MPAETAAINNHHNMALELPMYECLWKIQIWSQKKSALCVTAKLIEMVQYFSWQVDIELVSYLVHFYSAMVWILHSQFLHTTLWACTWLFLSAWLLGAKAPFRILAMIWLGLGFPAKNETQLKNSVWLWNPTKCLFSNTSVRIGSVTILLHKHFLWW